MCACVLDSLRIGIWCECVYAQVAMIVPFASSLRAPYLLGAVPGKEHFLSPIDHIL